MAFETFKRGWIWFVDGLAEAWIAVEGRVARRPVTSIDLADGGGRVLGPSGAPLGRLVEEGGTSRLEPAGLARRLSGASIDLRIPEGWLFRRELDPVAAQSAPFLDAFVRHQIDRITPWRVSDVHYHILHAPLPGDAARLSVEIGVVPKRLVGATLALLAPLRPKAMRLVRPGPSGFILPLGRGEAERRVALRRPIGAAVLTIAAVLALATAWAWWSTGNVQAEIDAQDQVISDRKAVLAAAARRDRAGTEADAALRRLRAAHPRAVDIVEAISAALPDSAYLTDLSIGTDGVRVSGISRAVPALVPALETAGRFKDVAFAAATTRVEGGSGDRFHLEMKPAGLVPPAETAAPTPATDAETADTPAPP
ncbi:MAG TPA: PilN domain-containing protein [Lichenihabitans sp.]|jgi:general secretion pathway protein L|nr:PilN domain-containing protein [Lichenihabitans sp.]